MERIVVGVDGSEGAANALRWAVEEARAHGATLVPVLAWSYLDQQGVIGTSGFVPEYSDVEAKAALEAALAGVRADAPDVVIEPVVRCDLATRALLDEAENADLVVVGSRGLGGFSGLLLGSVSQQLTHHSPCPVVLIPASK